VHLSGQGRKRYGPHERKAFTQRYGNPDLDDSRDGMIGNWRNGYFFSHRLTSSAISTEQHYNLEKQPFFPSLTKASYGDLVVLCVTALGT